MSQVANRCKNCAVREVFRCPHVLGRELGPGHKEIHNCKHFLPKSRGDVPRAQKKKGSLGGG